jgi:hypothetical protein
MSVPFTIRGVFTDFVNLEGLARLEGTELILEFRTTHALSKLLPPSTRELRVPFSELEEATFKRRFCLGFVRLRARSLKVFAEVPGSQGCELRLRCRSEHREAAQELASRIDMSLVSQDLQRMVEAADSHRPQPALDPDATARRATPTKKPVSEI